MRNTVVILWALAAALLVIGVVAQIVMSGLDHESMSIAERLVMVDANAWADRLLVWAGVSALLAIATSGVQRTIRERAQL